MTLINPFHSAIWPRSIAHPEQYEPESALCLDWDLASLHDSEKKKVIAAWVKYLPSLSATRRLRVWSQVTQPFFDAICKLDGLEVLQLK